jgi:hypothetical protein
MASRGARGGAQGPPHPPRRQRDAHRYVRKGVLDEKEWEKHLKSLPDLADQALTVEASIEDDDFDDDEPEETAGEPQP